MENHQTPHDRENPSLPSSSPNSTSSSNSNNGLPTPSTPSPSTPKSIPRSTDPNPSPTTFVQADPSAFKQVVQMLTGSTTTTTTTTQPPKVPIPSAAKATGPKRPAFKLYERRSSLKNLKMISPLMPTFLNPNPNSPAFSPRNQPELLSPSILDLPSLVLSPVTPLIPDPFNRPVQFSSGSAVSAEDKAIAEKGFYLHPSPRTTPRDADPPRLLPLFPVTSPRVSSPSP